MSTYAQRQSERGRGTRSARSQHRTCGRRHVWRYSWEGRCTLALSHTDNVHARPGPSGAKARSRRTATELGLPRASDCNLRAPGGDCGATSSPLASSRARPRALHQALSPSTPARARTACCRPLPGRSRRTTAWTDPGRPCPRRCSTHRHRSSLSPLPIWLGTTVPRRARPRPGRRALPACSSARRHGCPAYSSTRRHGSPACSSQPSSP
mmetsp:Transcript_23064/g.68021  ORF Transcript_23064/g.68021 Transcript_23064/m.68021 type:complete len:210 (+) Transcript_23064:104-733(+)